MEWAWAFSAPRADYSGLVGWSELILGHCGRTFGHRAWLGSGSRGGGWCWRGDYKGIVCGDSEPEKVVADGEEDIIWGGAIPPAVWRFPVLKEFMFCLLYFVVSRSALNVTGLRALSFYILPSGYFNEWKMFLAQLVSICHYMFVIVCASWTYDPGHRPTTMISCLCSDHLVSCDVSELYSNHLILYKVIKL